MASSFNDCLPPGESDLQAYVDGQLDARRRPVVEAYLAANPDEAARIEAYRAQNARLNELFAGEMGRPLGGSLAGLERRLSRAMERQRSVRRALASAACVALAVGLGYALWPPADRRGDDGVRPTPVAVSGPLTTVAAGSGGQGYPGQPVSAEIETGDRAKLTDWFAERVDRIPATAPNLDSLGLSLVGGRVVSTAHGPAIQFVYRGDAGDQVVLFVASSENESQSPYYATIATIRDGQVALHWRDGRHVYGLTGNMAREVLFDVAQTVGEALMPMPVLDQALEQVVPGPLEPIESQPGGVVLVESGDEAQADPGQPPPEVQTPLVEEPTLPEAPAAEDEAPEAL